MTDTTVRFDLPGFRGELMRPGEAAYDEARKVFNGMIDRRPALICRCADADDVALAVRMARDLDMPPSIYGGGHGVTGSAVVDGGICIDMRGMRDITVDPAAKTARVAAGATWGEVDAATQEHGLAVTGGRVPRTGVAGLTLGAGSGWLERKCGFTCDNLFKAELVTADGRQVVASADENPDLLWALRGGGGNFGVVTAFHFRLHEIGPIMLAGILGYPAQAAAEVARFYREFMGNAPEEVGGALAFITAPPADFVPEPVRGHPIVGVIVIYAGPVEEGEQALRPLREFGPPAIDLVQPMPYVAVQRLIEEGNPEGFQNYWTADFYHDLPDEAIDVLVERATKPVSPFSQVVVVPGGGAISRLDDGSTALSYRSAGWCIHYLSLWPDPSQNEVNIAHTRGMSTAMKPWSTGGVYLNFIGDEGLARVASAYGPERYARLQAIKATWDPTNLFRHNQNIAPASN